MLWTISNSRITGPREDGEAGMTLEKAQDSIGRGQSRHSHLVCWGNGECSAVVRAQSMGWGGMVRDEAAGQGRARSSRAS